MMGRRGFDLLIVYLDDFLIIADSQEKCATALNCLIQLLRKLGFAIHWGKVVDPTTKITFLGTELDSMSMSMRLPSDELHSFTQDLQDFLQRIHGSKRQLQAIAGRLSWAAGVVKGQTSFSLSHLRRRLHMSSLSLHFLLHRFPWWMPPNSATQPIAPWDQGPCWN